MRLAIALALPALLTAGLPSPQAGAPERGVQVRINGNVIIGADARDDLVLVVRGDARVEGEVRALVVVEGNAVLAGARVEDLTVVRGRADVLEGTTVTGNVHLLDADVSVDPGASVLGTIERGYSWEMLRGFWFLAAVFAIGLTIAMLVSGVVAAAVAPEPLRRAGAALTDEIGKSALAALIVWVALPIVAVALFATVIGIPTALGFFVFVMPTIGFLGYLVTGTRLGDWIVGRVRGRVEAYHPYLAAILGVGILLVAARVPVLGALVTPLAGILGGGAIGLVAWRAIRTPRVMVQPVPRPTTEPGKA